MKLGIPVYDGVNLLDVAGPLEMFYWAGRENPLETVLISANGTPVTSINHVRFEVQANFPSAAELDIVWVPGGAPESLQTMMQDSDHPYFRYLRQVAVGASWVCSVCGGALLLARAGLLNGHKATTHWQFVNCLKQFRGIDVDTERKRYVVSGNRLTGGGISSGLDEALKLICLLFGDNAARSTQATTQYFPDPPVSGTLPDAPACMIKWE